MEKMMGKGENTENCFKDANEVEDTDRGEMPRKYYKTRNEAEDKRTRGGRIYYKPGKGFYIVKPKKRNWCNIF